MTDFDKAFDRVFLNEGGFQNHRNDRGNWTGGKVGTGKLLGTNFGLSAMSYPHLDIPNLSRQDAKAVYKQDWWEELNMQAYPPSLVYQLFDAAITHGSFQTVKMLQRAVNTKTDGIVGPKTHACIVVTEKNDLLFRFIAQRLLFMTGIKTWKSFGKGWARRIAHNLIYASKDN